MKPKDEEIIPTEEVEGEEKSLKKLKLQLKKCKEENKELLLGWQRSRADFANLEKECAKSNEKARQSAKLSFVDDFLNVMDSFQMAFSNESAWQAVEENWRVGVEYIYSQAKLALEKCGVTTFAEVGDQFDPRFHQSTESVETKKRSKDHKIAEVTKAGYKLGEDIIRPASVKVFIYKEG